jgi:hypothetical protein
VVTICTTSLTFNGSTFCPHSVFVCFVWIWEQTAIISVFSIKRLVFITEAECVYCAERIEYLCIILLMYYIGFVEPRIAVNTYHWQTLWPAIQRTGQHSVQRRRACQHRQTALFNTPITMMVTIPGKDSTPRQTDWLTNRPQDVMSLGVWLWPLGLISHEFHIMARANSNGTCN